MVFDGGREKVIYSTAFREEENLSLPRQREPFCRYWIDLIAASERKGFPGCIDARGSPEALAARLAPAAFLPP